MSMSGGWFFLSVSEGTLAAVRPATWVVLFEGTGVTFLRVVASLVLASLWAVPAGIWIGTSQRRVRALQPVIQVLASFPAPMLYPLVLTLMFAFRIPFGVGAMLLMLLGVQWYILFNVLAGAMRVPLELKYASLLMGFPESNFGNDFTFQAYFQPSSRDGLPLPEARGTQASSQNICPIRERW